MRPVLVPRNKLIMTHDQRFPFSFSFSLCGIIYSLRPTHLHYYPLFHFILRTHSVVLPSKH